ncbi:membrane dipeptidase [Sedimentibacter acidaminivorans]|uniref:Membrane dipeptidase n=1 Tax=Sedimentibacter acidaminivorans TaxID=913099 RepID=A0ABS4GCY7_9FIRM|nr:membrane dipeptidase [Sedimentibacter acidaminivorans]MBP1925509.1 membrane dipeptidase [Sedimentibacter acidaminivorans]
MYESWNISKQAELLHEQAFVVDTTLPIMPGSKFSNLFSALDSMKGNGFNYVSITVASDLHKTMETIKNVTMIRALLLSRSKDIIFVKKVDDIKRAKKENKLAVGFHFQGTVPIGTNLSMVKFFYDRGIRHMLMAYNAKNLVGYGCHEEDDKGLSEFGRNLIKEMNKVGMIVDVAHTGYRTAMETIEASEAPVVVSHGNVAAVTNHQRCYKDDQIKAVAQNGGVFGVTGFGLFLGNEKNLVEQYVKNIDHIVQLVGPKHAGIGLDYVYDMDAFVKLADTNREKYPEDGGYFGSHLNQVEVYQIPQITEALLKLGYSDENVRDILGDNWLRIFSQVWKD